MIIKRLFFTVLLTLFCFVQVFAFGNKEIGLPKVDRLIRDRNYNEAIVALVEYIEENPEDFENAQRRIRRIIQLREKYNDHAESLLKVMENEPTNDKKKIEMIASMESLEKNPNLASQEFIENTKSAAQFTYYRALFEEVMQKSNNFIDNKEFIDAIIALNEGFVIYKNEFDEEYDEDLVTETNEILEKIFAIQEEIEIELALFNESLENLKITIKEFNLDEIENIYEVFEKDFIKLIGLRNSISNNGWFFETSFDNLSLTEEFITDNSFLPFAYRLVLGRKNTNRYEGMLGSLDSFINMSIENVEKDFWQVIAVLWDRGFASLKKGIASDDLQNILIYTDYGNKLAKTFSSIEVREDSWGIKDYKLLEQQYNLVASTTKSALDLIPHAEQIQVLHSRYNALPEYIPTQILHRQTTKEAIEARNLLVRDYENLANQLQKMSDTIENQIDSNTGSLQEKIALEIVEHKESMLYEIKTSQMKINEESFAWFEKSLNLAKVDNEHLYNEGLALLEGVTNEETGMVYFYPQESIESFRKIRGFIASDLLTVNEVNEDAQKLNEFDKSFLINESIENINKIQDSLNLIDSEIVSAISRANSQLLQSNLAKQEAELRYTQAVAQLNQNNFQGAKDNLKRSQDRTIDSLSLQESIAYRNETDAKFKELGDEITRRENEAVVREVRSLITSGKNFYYQGNFEQAEQVLNQAKGRWRDTNIEENAEVVSWLGIVNTALSMKTGRTIPVSAPLYPQMSQLLNSASQFYNEGRSLISQGNRTEAIQVFSNAKEKLQQLKLVYPLNEDAGQLTLKIDQVIDPVAFQESFKQKINTIRSEYRTNPQNLYSELLDLYKLDPRYPGIKALIDEVEIFLGIQIPPPDPRSLARSRELTSSARQIFNSNNRTMFQVAIDQLDEAIKLNPNNNDAVSLKDRVQTAIGGQALAVLSAEDEQRYQQAVLELQRGNKITASAIVEQLMQNERSRNSAKIIDLKMRIDSQL